jgi:hypothetical protein
MKEQCISVLTVMLKSQISRHMYASRCVCVLVRTWTGTGHQCPTFHDVSRYVSLLSLVDGLLKANTRKQKIQTLKANRRIARRFFIARHRQRAGEGNSPPGQRGGPSIGPEVRPSLSRRMFASAPRMNGQLPPTPAPPNRCNHIGFRVGFLEVQRPCCVGTRTRP